MNKEQRSTIYLEAQRKWGIESQITIAIEELSELITVLAKRHRIINGSSHTAIISEIADAFIVLEQLAIIYNEEKINEVIEFKIKRLKDWIEKDEDVFGDERLWKK